MTAATVQVQDIAASYRGMFRRRQVLDGVDLAAAPGEIVAVVGPNGAGKTTLFLVLLGFLRPDRGVCLICGASPEVHRRLHGVGYLPETNPAVPPGWMGRDLLARGVDLAARSSSDADPLATAIERTGVDPAVLTRPFGKCSKGVQRRLLLAYALAGDPSFVLLDEPFSGLDAAGRVALRSEMVAARSRGATVLVATHELAEVERTADRTVILENGTMRQSGVSRATHRFTADLEAEIVSGR